MSNVKNAVAVLLGRKDEYELAESYYEGTVGEVFTSHALRRHLRGNTAYRVNFTRTVVDAVHNRLELANVVASTQTAQNKIGKFFEQDSFQIEANDIHLGALEYGDAYAIVWPNEDGEWEVTYNSPVTTTIIYDPETRKKSYAAKMWVNGEGNTRLNLYFPDRIEKYNAKGDLVTDGTPFQRFDTVDNPFGEVPVFHFRTHRPYGKSEAKDAWSLQDMINKTLITHMYTMDYQGAPQRYALSNYGNDAEFEDFAEDDTARENIGALKNGPGELWYMKGVTQVGQFQPADSDTFLKPVREFLKNMATVTSTPVHYFDRGASGFSGEALRSSEAPLMKKIADRQQSFGATWRDLFRFLLKQEGITSDVTVKWVSAESLDGLDTWDVMLKKINAGLSHRQALREGGYDEQLIEKIMEERAQEAAEGSYYQRKPEARVAPESTELHDAVTNEEN